MTDYIEFFKIFDIRFEKVIIQSEIVFMDNTWHNINILKKLNLEYEVKKGFKMMSSYIKVNNLDNIDDLEYIKNNIDNFEYKKNIKSELKILNYNNFKDLYLKFLRGCPYKENENILKNNLISVKHSIECKIMELYPSYFKLYNIDFLKKVYYTDNKIKYFNINDEIENGNIKNIDTIKIIKKENKIIKFNDLTKFLCLKNKIFKNYCYLFLEFS